MLNLNKREIELLRFLLDQNSYFDLLNDHQMKILSGLRKKLTKNNIKDELFIDGAADLHTKRAGIGGVFIRNEEQLNSFSEFIGPATNNEAEYQALIKGLELAYEMNIVSINIYSDSELVVKQINGLYKVKNDRMKSLHKKVFGLLNNMKSWKINHIPREKNTVADQLSKTAMKSGKKK